MRATSVALLSAFCLLPVFLFAEEPSAAPAPVSFSVPEKMINDNLKGQVFEGDGDYDSGMGEVPYTWKITDMTCALKEGYAEVKGTAEVSANGITTKEEVTGKVKVKLFVKKQTIRGTVDSLLVPLYVPILGVKKKVGDIDLASTIGPQEVAVADITSQAAAFLPKDQEVTITSLNIVTGNLKLELVLKPKAPAPKSSN